MRPVNAKAETAHEKPMFKKLIRERRCLIPANCYYEWKEMPVGKRPYCIRMKDESPFFIGGMWDVWHAKEELRISLKRTVGAQRQRLLCSELSGPGDRRLMAELRRPSGRRSSSV